MMKILQIACLLFLPNLILLAQQPYKRFFPLRLGENPELEQLDIRQTYRLSNEELMVVGDALEDGKDFALHLVYLKKKTSGEGFEEHFRSSVPMKSINYNPSFYRCSDNNILIICSAGSAETAWQETVFLLKNGTVKEIGALDIVVEEAGKYQSIVPYLKITKEGEHILFKVDASLMPKNEKSHKKSANIEYLYDGTSLKTRS